MAMGSASTSGSQSVTRPLTGAERQDLYNNAVGSINNTMRQSGSGYSNSTPARFTGSSGTGGPSITPWAGGPSAVSRTGESSMDMFPVGSIQQLNANATGGGAPAAGGGGFTASGNSSVNNGFDPAYGFAIAQDPTVRMPTGTPDQGGLPFPTWNTPTYQSPGAAQQLSNGDYGALQNRMQSGFTSALDSQKAVDRTDKNSDLAARGIWSTGLADKAMTDIDRAYAPAYAAAGANAASTAANLQLQQNRDVNSYNTNNAQNANNFNLANTQGQYTAGWAPLEYLRQLWAGTAGNTSGSTSTANSASWNGSSGGGGGIV